MSMIIQITGFCSLLLLPHSALFHFSDFFLRQHSIIRHLRLVDLPLSHAPFEPDTLVAVAILVKRVDSSLSSENTEKSGLQEKN